jgi:hypothetical protein
MNQILQNLTRALSLPVARTALLALLTICLVTTAFASIPPAGTPGYGGCCYGSDGVTVYCPGSNVGCTNDVSCSTYACGFLWLSMCFGVTGVSC